LIRALTGILPPTIQAGERVCALRDEETQIWYYGLDADAQGEAAFIDILDDQEYSQATRFRFAKHRSRFIVRRGILRTILAQYADCKPEAIRFKCAAHGKPYIAWPRSASAIRFSMSSSHGLGAVAVTWRNELGLDIERVRPDCDHELVTTHEFAAEEREWLCHLPKAERLKKFFELWTCKEAYLKGTGFGLIAPLSDFAISLEQGTPRLAWSNIGNSDSLRWSLHCPVIEPEFVACLAVRGDHQAVCTARWSY